MLRPRPHRRPHAPRLRAPRLPRRRPRLRPSRSPRPRPHLRRTRRRRPPRRRMLRLLPRPRCTPRRPQRPLRQSRQSRRSRPMRRRRDSLTSTSGNALQEPRARRRTAPKQHLFRPRQRPLLPPQRQMLFLRRVLHRQVNRASESGLREQLRREPLLPPQRRQQHLRRSRRLSRRTRPGLRLHPHPQPQPQMRRPPRLRRMRPRAKAAGRPDKALEPHQPAARRSPVMRRRP
jgi:hypothetical protein